MSIPNRYKEYLCYSNADPIPAKTAEHIRVTNKQHRLFIFNRTLERITREQLLLQQRRFK